MQLLVIMFSNFFSGVQVNQFVMQLIWILRKITTNVAILTKMSYKRRNSNVHTAVQKIYVILEYFHLTKRCINHNTVVYKDFRL